MSNDTKIEWTDATFNIAWGCTKVSAGCAHCYAERDSHRRGFSVWGPGADRRVFGEQHWNEPRKWVRKWDSAGHGRPMRIFTSSMADVFEDHPTIATERAKLWPLIRSTPTALWQVVTKRPENFARFLPDDWGAGYPNVMLMVTAEDQLNADRRVPILLSTAAALRGVSYEPALGPVDFGLDKATCVNCCPRRASRWIRVTRPVGPDFPYLLAHPERANMVADAGVYRAESNPHGALSVHTPGGLLGVKPEEFEVLPRLDWIIVGGESGPGARPFDVAWARTTIAQCREAGVACFVKQLGAAPAVSGDEADVRHPTFKVLEFMKDRKGGDMAEWPEDLRVREFPAVRT